MTISASRAALAALVLGCTLAACGGGGGGSSSPIPPTGGGTTQTHGALRASFARGTGTASQGRSTKGLAGGLVPIADFVLPESYVGYKPYDPTSIDAVAYYDPTAPMPSPLPTSVTWAVSGAAGASTSNAQFGGGLLGQRTSIGEVLLSSTGTTGIGTLTATASNGDSVALTYYAYDGTALDAETSYTPTNTGMPMANTQPCLTFAAANGTPATPGTTGDLCLTINADHSTSLTAPHGIMLVQKPIDAVTIADVATFNASTTTIAGMTIAPATVSSYTFTIVVKTASGALVKFMPTVIGGGDARVSANQPVYAFGAYRIGSATSGWDF